MVAYIPVAQVLRPQGILGLVKARPDTDDPERLCALSHVFVQDKQGAYRSVSVEDAQVRDGAVYLRLDGAQDRNAAEKQRGWLLHIDRTQIRELSDDETLICDLIGCRVVDTKGIELGVLKDVLQPGANDVYVVATNKGDLMIPALKRVFPRVDVAERVIVADEAVLPEVSVYAD